MITTFWEETGLDDKKRWLVEGKILDGVRKFYIRALALVLEWVWLCQQLYF